MHSLAFSVYLVSVRRNETQNVIVEYFYANESNIWIWCLVMLKLSLKSYKNQTKNIWWKTKGGFAKHDLKKLFWRTAIMNRTNHAYILIDGTRAMFYFRQLRPNGFLLQKNKGIRWSIVQNYKKLQVKSRRRYSPSSKLQRRIFWKKVKHFEGKHNWMFWMKTLLSEVSNARDEIERHVCSNSQAKKPLTTSLVKFSM